MWFLVSSCHSPTLWTSSQRISHFPTDHRGVDRHTEERPNMCVNTHLKDLFCWNACTQHSSHSMWSVWSSGVRQSTTHTHTHISSIADRTTLSAKCHRSSIQYTSYRPVNRLLIQTALILSRFLLHMLCVNVSPTFVILSFRIFILNFVFG